MAQLQKPQVCWKHTQDFPARWAFSASSVASMIHICSYQFCEVEGCSGFPFKSPSWPSWFRAGCTACSQEDLGHRQLDHTWHRTAPRIVHVMVRSWSQNTYIIIRCTIDMHCMYMHVQDAQTHTQPGLFPPCQDFGLCPRIANHSLLLAFRAIPRNGHTTLGVHLSTGINATKLIMGSPTYGNETKLANKNRSHMAPSSQRSFQAMTSQVWHTSSRRSIHCTGPHQHLTCQTQGTAKWRTFGPQVLVPSYHGDKTQSISHRPCQPSVCWCQVSNLTCSYLCPFPCPCP